MFPASRKERGADILALCGRDAILAKARALKDAADLKRALELLSALCKDPVRDKTQCLSRVTVLSGLVQIGVKHREADAVETYHKQYDAMLPRPRDKSCTCRD